MTIAQLIDELATVGSVVGLNAEVRAWYIGAEPTPLADAAHATPLEVGRAVPSPPWGGCGVEKACGENEAQHPAHDGGWGPTSLPLNADASCGLPQQRMPCAAPLLPLDVLRTVSVLAGFDRVTQCSTGVIQIKP